VVTPIKIHRPDGNFSACFAMTRKTLPELLSLKHLYLSESDSLYFEKLSVERRQHSFLLGRFAGKAAVSTLTGEQDLQQIAIHSGVFTQPIVRCASHPNVQVSIAHCGKWGAALAFPEAHPMGIDLEETSGSGHDAIMSQLTQAEQAMLAGLPLEKMPALSLVWTVKEALSKVFRTGLMADPMVYELKSIVAGQYSFESMFKNWAQYKALSWFFAGMACSIALPHRSSFDLARVIDSQNRINDLP
jgi:phosphopantetheinyl transferase